MVTISPTDYGYIYTTTTNTTSPLIDNNYVNNTAAGITVTLPERKNVVSASDLAEALFVLKPKLSKKYKEDTNQFIADVMAAATHSEGEDALWKLGKLGVHDV